MWQWGIAFGSTMIHHLLECYSFPCPELFFGLAVKPLDTFNLGKAFNKQGCLFPIFEDMFHLLYSKGKEDLPLGLLILTAVL